MLTLLPADREVLTTGYAIDFLAPACGDWIEATAVVIRSGKTLTVCRIDAHARTVDAPLRLAAVAQQTLARAVTSSASPGLLSDPCRASELSDSGGVASPICWRGAQARGLRRGQATQTAVCHTGGHVRRASLSPTNASRDAVARGGYRADDGPAATSRPVTRTASVANAENPNGHPR